MCSLEREGLVIHTLKLHHQHCHYQMPKKHYINTVLRFLTFRNIYKIFSPIISLKQTACIKTSALNDSHLLHAVQEEVVDTAREDEFQDVSDRYREVTRQLQIIKSDLVRYILRGEFISMNHWHLPSGYFLFLCTHENDVSFISIKLTDFLK